jgi:hypothetical protein
MPLTELPLGLSGRIHRLVQPTSRIATGHDAAE